jgi:hypothetical protein
VCGPILDNRAATNGFDIVGTQPASAQDCQKQCQANPNCTAWTYIYDWATPQCYVKYAPATVLPGAVSGADSGTCAPTQLYKCAKGECVENNASDSGLPLDQCENFCLSPSDNYICAGGGVCVPSVEPGRGDDMQTCMKDCGQITPVSGAIPFKCSLQRYLDVATTASCNDACSRWCDASRNIQEWQPECIGGYVDIDTTPPWLISPDKMYGDATMLLADDVYCNCTASGPAP